jgi:flagellar basal-body rod protein FlgG
MNPALWVAKTGLDAEQTRMSVISNNLANINTTGFKKDRASFQDLLYQKVKQAGGQTSQETVSPSGLMLGTGVEIVGTQKMHTMGNLIHSGNSLDLAIKGRGFFSVLMPDGTTSYTRDGAFQISPTGQLVTGNGLVLQPAITLPSEVRNITLGEDGTVSVVTGSNTTPQIIGNIQLTDFVNPAGLEPIGQNLFRETAASGTAAAGTPGLTGLGAIAQGMLETSNVNVVEEMVSMIETQRAYETNAKAVSAVDQMMQYANNNI